MYWLIIVPFIVQLIAMSIDEGYFHWKRGLPKWERIGHPIDTLSVVICFLFVFFVPFSSGALKIFIGLAAISCLLVTKDEFVHKHVCPASENWLHALLFINHPIILTATGLIWCATSSPAIPQWIVNWLGQSKELRAFLVFQIIGSSLFMIYQIVYWNFIWKEKQKA
ncbi:MAG: hypothetical protein LVR00_08275 [Rhabdochlamydiaceae bacterium]